MASEILFNLINEYAGPILEASGYRISPLGFIESFNGEKICYQNPKYVTGVNDPQNPPIIYPVVPIDDKSYLNIKATPEYELYNPFQTFKQMCILLIKLKKVLIPFFISDEKLDNTDEDDYDKFDELFQMYNKRNETGEYEIGVVCLEDQQNPKEIMKFSSDSVIKSAWGLCVEIYNNFCNSTQLKQYKNVDRSWSKIQKLCEEWDKARKMLMNNVSVEHNNVANPENMNYSGEDDTESFDDTDFLSGYRFVVPNDPMDKNDEVLQNYLTSMFPQEQLEPYVEPEPDDDVELTTEDEIIIPNVSVSEETNDSEQKSLISMIEEKDKLEAKAEGAILQAKMDDDNNVQQEEKRGVFSCVDNRNNSQIQQPNVFGMNPMMGGFNPYGIMNPMNMGMNNMPNANINDMNLDRNFVDPFAMYR